MSTNLATVEEPFYLSDLNPMQRQAVESTEGPVLVLAGAGTGKTRVLTTRIAHIMSTGLAFPSQVLSVTFTNKAANEMKERVAGLLGRPIEGLWMGTFHSIAVRILRRHAELIDLNPGFTILDSDDQLRLLKQILKAEGVDDKKHPPRMVQAIIGRWKDRALLPNQVTQAEASSIDRLLKIYEIYQQRLKILNAVDFGDILLHCLTLFREQPEVLKSYHHQFKYILVDEYQDTNVAQYLWLRLLAQGSGNICCVGDDDQSIYGWRGAEVGNILKFEKDFNDATVIRLEQNYRSTTHILGAASGLISQNKGRLGKDLWTESDGGEKVLVRGTWDSIEEARYIGSEIERFHRDGHSLNTMAILVRAGFQTREFEDRLLTLAIPYRVIGGPRFYERLEIRDALAYFRMVVQPNDGMAFERIINTPKRGIGQATMQKIHLLSREAEIPLPQATIRLMEQGEIKGKAKAALEQLFNDLTRWREQLAHLEHQEVAKMILDESGYTAMWRADKSADAPGRLENLKELVAALAEFGTLQEFLEHIGLVMDNTKEAAGDHVTIMTLHAAKGLEFDTVFLAGWEENLFPHQRSLDESGLEGLEEERRLAYVGITRAKKRSIITFALNRKMYQGWQFTTPSRFIKELPPEHINVVQASGARGMPQAGMTAPTQHNDDFDGKTIDVETSPSEGSSLNPYTPGDKVFHQKFGYGYVTEISANKLAVNFKTSGIKKIIASFVEPA